MNKCLKFAPTVLLALCLAAPVRAQVYSPRVLAEGQPDASSLKSLVSGIYERAQAVTPRQKAEAIWRFFLTDGRFVKPGFWYHIAGWAYEEPFGEVLDPVKLLNSYGFGLCYHIAPLLEAVFEAGGLDARVWFLTGHTVAEVYYDGAYHHYDSDMMGYTTLGDKDPKTSTVASVRQLEDDGRIMLGKLESPTRVNPAKVEFPWYPADVREAAVVGLAELFTTKADNSLFPHHRYSEGHTMDLVLRPGERMIRFFEPESERAYYLPYAFDGKKWREFPREIARYKIRTEDGPHSQRDNRRWATGRLEYAPPLRDESVYLGGSEGRYSRNLSLPAAATGRKFLTRSNPALPAEATFEVQSPYVLIDARFEVGAALASEAHTLEVETSTDMGRTWERAGELKGPHNGGWEAEPAVRIKSEHGRMTAITGTYGYLVRFRMHGAGPADAIRIDSVRIDSRFQVNPRTLPAVKDGSTRLAYKAGPQQRRWALVSRIDRIADVAQKISHFRHVEEEGQHLFVPVAGKRAEAVFEVSAPNGADLTSFDAGGRFLDIRDGIVPDKLTAEIRKTRALRNSTELAPAPSASVEWALSPKGPYKMLWKYDAKQAWPDGQDVDRMLRWPDFGRTVRKLPADTKRVYVRYSSEGLALDDVRLAATTKASANSALTVTHVWAEGGQEKRHTERVAQPWLDHTYSVKTGKGPVTNRAVIFECPAQ